MTLNLTDLDAEAWRAYMVANARAKEEYAHRPAARPHILGHFLCLCCDILTAHPSSVCLSCQARSQEWSALANDPAAIADLRYKNKRMPRQLRRVVFG